jgi:hypothetical protein
MNTTDLAVLRSALRGRSYNRHGLRERAGEITPMTVYGEVDAGYQEKTVYARMALLGKVIATQVDMEGALLAPTSPGPLVFGSCNSGSCNSGSYTESQVGKNASNTCGSVRKAFKPPTTHNHRVVVRVLRDETSQLHALSVQPPQRNSSKRRMRQIVIPAVPHPPSSGIDVRWVRWLPTVWFVVGWTLQMAYSGVGVGAVAPNLHSNWRIIEGAVRRDAG